MTITGPQQVPHVSAPHCREHGLEGCCCDSKVTESMVYVDQVSGPDAVFCGDCFGPAKPGCDYFGHGLVTLGELFDAYS